MPAGSPRPRPPRDRIEAALLVVLPATVFAFAMGSGSVSGLVDAGRLLRWVLLFVLAALAIAYGWSERRRVSRVFVAVAGTLGVVGVLSVGWSVDPRISAERALSFLVLITVATFVAAGAARSARRRERVLTSLLAGAVAVALAGLVVLAADHAAAVQAQSSGMSARFRGFGENPNTAAMLFALVLPIALWQAFAARGLLRRTAALAAAGLLYGSIVASGSRGAMLGAAVGVGVFLVLRVRPLGLLVPALTAVAAVLVVSLVGTGQRPAPTQAAPPTSTSPSAPAPAAPAAKPTTPAPRSGGGGRFRIELLPTLPAGQVPRPFPPEQDEIGWPGIYQYKPILAYGSGRVYAWLAAIQQGLRRPLLGYGFGTEQYVFADRFLVFQGNFAENAFVGMFLELGVLGVLLLLAPFAAVGWLALAALRGRGAPGRNALAVGAGVVAAGFVIAFFQSYLYSVGNVATLGLWLVTCLTLTVSATVEAGA